MNLVQINERLKDMPMQAVQQYANGSNPSIPPYLALAEIQRRQKMQQQMANAQGAAMGQQPSVKEQIEQKAGLMGLQQAQLQQQQAQMMQPRPGPVPAGTPQPQAQPQEEMAMAAGGIARIPVRSDLYQFSGGGIIAFDDGGSARVKQILSKSPYERTPEENEILRQSGIKVEGRSLPADSGIANLNRSIGQIGPKIREYLTQGASRLSEEELAAQPKVGGAMNERILRSLGLGQSAPAPAPAPQAPSEADLDAAAQSFEGLPSQSGAPVAARPPAPAARPPVPPTAPGQAPQPPANAGIASLAPQRSPLFKKAEQSVSEAPAAPTTQGIIEEQRALAPAAMQEDAMQKRIADQRARAEAQRAAFEKTRPSGLDDLIRVFGQAGQYKGLSGTGPAYTAMQQQKRAEELAMEKQQNELLTAIEGREYEGAKELFGARTKAMDAANRAYQERLKSRSEVLASLANADQRSIDSALDRLSREQIAKLQIAAANRPTEAERIEANYLKMVADGKKQEAEDYLNRMLKIKGGGAAGVGSERNTILARRQEMKELESVAKNESGQFSEEDSKWAAARIAQLARENAKEAGAGSSIPSAAVDALRRNPSLAAQFDQKYGAGASAQYLQK